MGKLSKKKSGWKPLEIPIVIPKDTGPKTETMEYNESFKYKSWEMERELADKIVTNVQKKGFNVKLDDLTQGKGSCFMVAVLQQMKRPDVREYLNEEQRAIKNSLEFRWSVNRFRIRQANNEKIQNMKMLYNATTPRVSWEVYWREMTKEKPIMEWADGWFIQVTAWYLGLDLWIFDTAGEDYTEIQGNWNNPEDGTPVALILGYLHNAHYQSLLWETWGEALQRERKEEAEELRKELDEKCPGWLEQMKKEAEEEKLTEAEGPPGFEDETKDDNLPPSFDDERKDENDHVHKVTANWGKKGGDEEKEKILANSKKDSKAVEKNENMIFQKYPYDDL